jgi:gamma-glutamyl-gamma-aminobutyrate hydrolase PuuD
VSKPKVYIVGRENGFQEFYEQNGFDVTGKEFNADLFQFTGGEDVTPEIYGEENIASYNNLNRDLYEAGYFALARRLDKPMVGVCRGGQFLNVMCGGWMDQDVPGHTRDHKIITATGSLMATSTHHQMMRPGAGANLLAWADIVGELDTEVLFYEHYRCLCFQPHPEYRRFPELEKYYFGLIHNLLLNR